MGRDDYRDADAADIEKALSRERDRPYRERQMQRGGGRSARGTAPYPLRNVLARPPPQSARYGPTIKPDTYALPRRPADCWAELPNEYLAPTVDPRTLQLRNFRTWVGR